MAVEKKSRGFLDASPEQRAEWARAAAEKRKANKDKAAALGIKSVPQQKGTPKPPAGRVQAVIPAAKKKGVSGVVFITGVVNAAIAGARVGVAQQIAGKAVAEQKATEQEAQNWLAAKAKEIEDDQLDAVEVAGIAVETIELAWRYPRSRGWVERFANGSSALGLLGVAIVIAVPRLHRRGIIPAGVMRSAQPVTDAIRAQYKPGRPVPNRPGGASGGLGTDEVGKDDAASGAAAPADDAVPPGAASEDGRGEVPGGTPGETGQ